MSRDVVPQVDVGGLTLRGLSTFGPVLAALSADDVVPAAMIQMDQIGSHFHLSGPQAAKVPDLLQRCISTRLDRLGVSVGWRKGDAASYMAQTAGGQAISLLSLCLFNMFTSVKVGEVLFDLSKKLLCQDQSVSSINQLAKVATLLASKLGPLGYGNHMAQQTLRIQQALEYTRVEKLSCRDAFDMFEAPTRETASELLYAISKVFCEENCVVRITGRQSMAHIVTFATILFRDDLCLTVNGFIIQEGANRSILIEILPATIAETTTTVQVESNLPLSSCAKFPIEVEPRDDMAWPNPYYSYGRGAMTWPNSHYSYAWEGHIADALHLSFSTAGLSCSQDLLDACCDLLIMLVIGFRKDGNPVTNEQPLLGVYPQPRLHEVLAKVIRAKASLKFSTVESAFENLSRLFRRSVVKYYPCTCFKCGETSGWQKENDQNRNTSDCVPGTFWRNVGNAINALILCLLIKSSPNAVVVQDGNKFELSSALSSFVQRELDKPAPLWFEHRKIITRFSGYSEDECKEALASSNGSSTIFPLSLLKLRRDVDDFFQYELNDGRLIINQQYYSRLQSPSIEPRNAVYESKVQGLIRPSSIGEHSKLHFSVQEFADYLNLRTNIVADGQDINIDLLDCILASSMLRNAEPCEHSINTEFDTAASPDVLITSVAAPVTSGFNISIAQTKRNATAQMLACVPYKPALLMRECCLNCAVAQARARSITHVIVG